MIAGIVSDLRVINGQRGRLAIFKLDDKSQSIEATADEAVMNANRNTLKDDELVIVSGRLQPGRGGLTPSGGPGGRRQRAPPERTRRGALESVQPPCREVLLSCLTGSGPPGGTAGPGPGRPARRTGPPA